MSTLRVREESFAPVASIVAVREPDSVESTAFTAGEFWINLEWSD